ncbi:argininosuccinate synthase [candidate division WOR-1 bacterium RIFOXYA12_FULL_52_29]|uniref:Argininosuccinate synthase n=1 Tax=candidate division WOR-1 bacterium RIFOXYC12_FULL_54_18 TaxID=1802584 RepID=A0A1F4T7C9_UNCSA|nr:MAG: argininosuccinate synthase [candidate division WOR-1 bacterium RIFOXYA2_FULL_51_19]OGC18208.1 MAG: argininosuccinate synthase [candidate division WOR-1 bacterium RIFOXYA12_FULL_52_29]OGC27063.1 MAG: argininosuccinate synthase [candidate division WOR-1 bacterium RIFOXYB2_FULL_45_9]OGC28625.1 MAG: argininosuccinate synthase [candidate division WOR-1 bacterium RIFOXYC12_FULL_54_18]OGC30920.1 MAG: argininosuccinate synthase [candidate division WOR-1 bacterium RIFOXYB12_FULL_52_16]
MSKIKKVVLAYSGGLDTSIMIKWLKDNYGCEVIAYAADVGQAEELDGLKEKAIKTGASKIYIEDLREVFVRDFIFPMLKAGAIYEGQYLLGTSIARPIIAKRQIEIALKEKADAVAHGATGKGNDQVRFELTFKALAPKMKVIAPWREWELKGREEEIAYAREHNIPIPVTKKKPYSSDRNLWHISYEGGVLEDPWFEPKEEMFLLSVSPQKAPNSPEYVEIDFYKGEPTTVNGRKLAPVPLIEELNKIGGRNGVGRVDIVENRLVGIKSRGVYETPGGTILYAAHQALESLTLDRDVSHYKQQVAQRYAELVYNGQWFTPLKEALDAFVNATQRNVSGRVRLKLFKGNCTVVGRSSDRSLYRPDLATFEKEDIYNQKDAEGFINLFGLPIKVAALLKK